MQYDPNKLKFFFSEILKGYSYLNSQILGDVYIRHLDAFGASKIDILQEKYYSQASMRGLPTQKDKEEYLYKEGLWTPAKDEEIVDLKSFITGLKLSKTKQLLQSQIDLISAEITKSEEKIKDFEFKKAELLGFTCESYASKRISEYFMLVSTFKDEGLKTPLFNNEEYENLEDNKVRELVTLYNLTNNNLQSISLKRIAISPFFLGFFRLCEDNPYTFYGKPVVALTYHQMELFTYARCFKSVLSEIGEITPEFYENPDRLIESHQTARNTQATLDKYDDKMSSVAIMGATKADMAKIKANNPGKTIDLAAEAAKRGGVLQISDLMKLELGQ